MKKLIKSLSFALLACLIVSAFFGCNTRADLTLAKRSLASLELEARRTTTAETVDGTEKTISGSYKYKEIEPNVTFSYNVDKENVKNLDRYTRLFKVTTPENATPFMLIVDDYTEDSTNWTIWNVLENITYPAFQYNDMQGGSDQSDTMKTFLANKSATHKGYWGNASAGNSYEANKQENGNLKADLEFYFGADKIGTYKVTMELVDLANGNVFHSVSKIINVE